MPNQTQRYPHNNHFQTHSNEIKASNSSENDSRAVIAVKANLDGYRTE